MFTGILMLSMGAGPAPIIVENKCQTSITVTNKISSAPAIRPTTVRVAHGHTHTCSNGHTWDHDSNPTHTCQVCGLQQWVQDATPRTVPTLMYSLPGVQSGCPDGKCNLPTQHRKGFFR